jgi:hypothetical protein
MGAQRLILDKTAITCKRTVYEKGLVGCVFFLIGCFLLATHPGQVGFIEEHHGFLSSHGLTLAQNLSFEHHGLLFNAMSLDPQDQKVVYDSYTRFPVTFFALLKMVLTLVPQNLAAQMQAAHTLMLGFFLLAMVGAYRALYLITAGRRLALFATLMGFSGFYVNYYSDMIFNDIPTLCGCFWVFEGACLYCQKQLKSQFFCKSLLGAALGLQVVALLMVFAIAFGAARLYRKAPVSSLWMSPPFKGLMAAGACVVLLLAANLAIEAQLTGNSILESPSLVSAQNRMGIGVKIDLLQLVASEGAKAFSLTLPAAVSGAAFDDKFKAIWQEAKTPLMGVLGLIFLQAALIAHYIFNSRHRVLLVTLACFGLPWALALPEFVIYHSFQSIFYLGYPLLFFLALGRCFPRHGGWLVALAVMTFCLSNGAVSHLKGERLVGKAAKVNDYAKIRRKLEASKPQTIHLAKDRFTLGDAEHAVEYYLAGHYLQTRQTAHGVPTNYLLTTERAGLGPRFKLLTPDNAEVFLYQVLPGEKGGLPWLSRLR